MSLEQLMENPYAWLMLAICTVFSVIYAVYTGIESKEKKQISYLMNTHEIVRAGKDIIPDFRLSYRNQSINDLTVTRVTMWNSGNRLLNFGDIVETKPISIISDGGADILDASIIKRSEESNKFTISKKNPHYAEVGFDYVDKLEGIVVQIIHTGSAEELHISGKIKGGKKLKNVVKNNFVIKDRKVWRKICAVTACVGAVVSLACLAILSLHFIGVISSETFYKILFVSVDPNPLAIVATTYLLTFFMIILCYQILVQTFHLKIPASLRQAVEYDK